MKIRNELYVPNENFLEEDYTEYDGVLCKEGKVIIFLDGGMILVDEYNSAVIQDYPDLEYDSFEELQEKLPDWKMLKPINTMFMTIKEG